MDHRKNNRSNYLKHLSQCRWRYERALLLSQLLVFFIAKLDHAQCFLDKTAASVAYQQWIISYFSHYFKWGKHFKRVIYCPKQQMKNLLLFLVLNFKKLLNFKKGVGWCWSFQFRARRASCQQQRRRPCWRSPGRCQGWTCCRREPCLRSHPVNGKVKQNCYFYWKNFDKVNI